MLQKIQISFYLFFNSFFIIIVIGLAANKGDLYEQQQVSEKEGKEYAKQIGAILKETSACTGVGVNELFTALSNKFLDPNYIDKENEDDYNENQEIRKNKTVVLDPKKMKQDKNRFQKCCGNLDFLHIFKKK